MIFLDQPIASCCIDIRLRQVAFFLFIKVSKCWLSSFNLLKDFEIKKSFSCSSLFLYYVKQIDFMLLCLCSVIDHRRRQNVIRASRTHLVIALCATFLFLPHFDVICKLSLIRCMATWNLLFFSFIDSSCTIALTEPLKPIICFSINTAKQNGGKAR